MWDARIPDSHNHYLYGLARSLAVNDTDEVLLVHLLSLAYYNVVHACFLRELFLTCPSALSQSIDTAHPSFLHMDSY